MTKKEIYSCFHFIESNKRDDDTVKNLEIEFEQKIQGLCEKQIQFEISNIKLSSFLKKITGKIDFSARGKDSIFRLVTCPPILGHDYQPLSSQSLTGFRLNPEKPPDHLKYNIFVNPNKKQLEPGKVPESHKRKLTPADVALKSKKT